MFILSSTPGGLPSNDHYSHVYSSPIQRVQDLAFFLLLCLPANLSPVPRCATINVVTMRSTRHTSSVLVALSFASSTLAAYLTTMPTTALATTTSPPVVTAFLPARSAVPQDPSDCQTINMTAYYDCPIPSGTFLDSVQSYMLYLAADCVAAGNLAEYCPFPPNSAVCGYSTFVPSTVLPDWSSYAVAASEWWYPHASGLASVVQHCPITWQKATFQPDLDWLNMTAAMAECQVAKDMANVTASITSSPASTSSLDTAPSVATSTASSTNPGSNIVPLSPLALVAGPALAAYFAGI